MKLIKITPIILIGFSLFCLFQTTQARCEIKFFKNEINSLDYLIYDRDDAAPFIGWSWFTPTIEDELQRNTYSSFRAFQADSCTDCQLTVYSDNAFGGKSQNFDLDNVAESALEFCAKSLVLDCPDLGPQLPQPGEQLRYQKISPVVYFDTDFVNVMNAGLTLALNKAIAEGQISSWQYWVTNIRQVDRSVDYDYLHRYDVYIINNLGDNYNIKFEISDHPDLSEPLLLTSSVAPWS